MQRTKMVQEESNNKFYVEKKKFKSDIKRDNKMEKEKNQSQNEFKMGLGDSGSIDVTRCVADDGSRITMIVKNGHISLNNVPVAVDDKGFVVSRDGSLLPIKYQDFYRQASTVRTNRMVAELASMSDVPSEEKEIYLRPTRRTALIPGPEIGYLTLSTFPEENKWLPREIRHLVNRISSKIDNLESAVVTSKQTVVPKPSERPRRSLSSSICNCIHSLRHRRTGSLLENEQDIHRDDNLDFVLRAMRDSQVDVGALQSASHGLSKKFRAMQKKILERERSIWALTKAVEAFTAGALSLEKEEAYVLRQYYDLLRTFVRYLKKGKESEIKMQELVSTNEKLLERVRQLEGQVQEMSTNEKLVERLKELADRVQEMSTAEPDRVDPPACPCLPDNIQPIEEASKSAETIDISEEGISDAVGWFKAFQAHQVHWKSFHDLSDSEKKNHKVLHDLKVKCGAINDQNKRLVSRLGLSETHSAKLKDQLWELLKEKQNIQQRLQTSQTLLRIAQNSFVSQPDEDKAGRKNVKGHSVKYKVSQSENKY